MEIMVGLGLGLRQVKFSFRAKAGVIYGLGWVRLELGYG